MTFLMYEIFLGDMMLLQSFGLIDQFWEKTEVFATEYEAFM